MASERQRMRPWVGLGWLAVAVWSFVTAYQEVGWDNELAVHKLLLGCAAMLIAGHEASLPPAAGGE